MNNKPITIYSIKFNDNIIYIGQTQKSVDGRWSDHKSRAKTETKRGEKLYNKIRKYGVENFSIESLCVVESHMADETEIKCIEIFDTIQNGCNLAIGGRVNRGMKRTPEQLEKQSQLKKEEYKNGKNPLSKWNGSQEQKDMISNLRKGKVLPWTPKIAEAKSHGPYIITVDSVEYIHKTGLNSFAKQFNLNSASLRSAFYSGKPKKLKVHIVTVRKQ